MNSKFLIGVIALIALGVFGVAFLQRPATQAPSTVGTNQTDTVGDPGNASTTQTASPQPTQAQYTLATVAQHNNGTSCWAAINGNVYDLTQWINQHPGGPERILNICGTDATAAFNAQHGGQRQPAQELQRFYLAPLAH